MARMKLLILLVMLVHIFSICFFNLSNAAALVEKRVVGGYEEHDPAVIEWQALILRKGTYVDR